MRWGKNNDVSKKSLFLPLVIEWLGTETQSAEGRVSSSIISDFLRVPVSMEYACMYTSTSIHSTTHLTAVLIVCDEPAVGRTGKMEGGTIHEQKNNHPIRVRA